MKSVLVNSALFLVCNLVVQTQVFALDEGQQSCLLEPSEEIDIASQVTGVVRMVNGERGDYVKKGEVLISLEQSLEVAEVNLAREKVKFSGRKVDRNQELIDQGLLTASEADEIQTEYKLYQLELKRAEKSLQQKIIYSPVNGVIIDRFVSKGEYAGIEPLMKLAVLNPLHAEVVMKADEYGLIKKGMKATVIPEGHQDESYTGIVKIVDQIIDAASATFGVVIEIQNPGFKLPAGLRCRVHYLDE